MIKGLEDLGCARATGEDQTICVLSDSFNNNGGAAGLQASGDLPLVGVVKVPRGCTRLSLNTHTPPASARSNRVGIFMYFKRRAIFTGLFSYS